MSVYIKGMEMPKNCHNCPLCLMRCCCAKGEELTEKQTRPNAERPQFCPLFPVPDHGRLIDADALEEKTDDRYSLGEIGRRERDDIVDALQYCAPTIIPADKGDGE